MNPSDIWDRRFYRLALEVAGWSKDRSTRVGCAIVGPNRELRSTGYNGFVRGADDSVEARYERPVKYAHTEHAERNAIYNAARMGLSMEGCTAYVATSSKLLGPPCVDCTRALIQSGIKRVVCEAGSDDPSKWRKDWAESMEVAKQMLIETGVVFETVAL